MADVLDRLKAALADRYQIERELGSGGMATVYLADDLKLHRKVAVKVLRPELAAALGPDRFVQEIDIAAKLTLGCWQREGSPHATSPHRRAYSGYKPPTSSVSTAISRGYDAWPDIADDLEQCSVGGTGDSQPRPDCAARLLRRPR
jgi:serine/threonine protein kinase